MPVVFNFFGGRAKDAIRNEAAARLDRLGKQVTARMIELAPEDTGYLKSTIHYVFDASNLTLTFHADAFYAAFQEFGSSRNPPHPFMRPALAEAGAYLGGSVSTTTLQFVNTPAKHAAGMAAQHGHAGATFGHGRLK